MITNQELLREHSTLCGLISDGVSGDQLDRAIERFKGLDAPKELIDSCLRSAGLTMESRSPGHMAGKRG